MSVSERKSEIGERIFPDHKDVWSFAIYRTENNPVRAFRFALELARCAVQSVVRIGGACGMPPSDQT